MVCCRAVFLCLLGGFVCFSFLVFVVCFVKDDPGDNLFNVYLSIQVVWFILCQFGHFVLFTRICPLHLSTKFRKMCLFVMLISYLAYLQVLSLFLSWSSQKPSAFISLSRFWVSSPPLPVLCIPFFPAFISYFLPYFWGERGVGSLSCSFVSASVAS